MSGNGFADRLLRAYVTPLVARKRAYFAKDRHGDAQKEKQAIESEDSGISAAADWRIAELETRKNAFFLSVEVLVGKKIIFFKFFIHLRHFLALLSKKNFLTLKFFLKNFLSVGVLVGKKNPIFFLFFIHFRQFLAFLSKKKFFRKFVKIFLSPNLSKIF